MSSIKLEQFGGTLPAWDAHLLPAGQAASAQNCYLFSGALTGWRKPKLLRALQDSAARMVYRIPTVSETQALAYLVFKLQPTAGDTVSAGDLTYTFRTVLTDQGDGRIGAPADVLIGSDTAATALNVMNAITADNDTNVNSGITYGEETASNGEVKFYASGDPIQGLAGPSIGTVSIASVNYTYLAIGSVDFGAAFNLIKVSESTSGVRVVWLNDLLSFSHTTTTYRGGTNPTFPNQIDGAATWLEFADGDTNIIRAPINDDQFQRFYFASPSQPPEYNTYDRIVAGLPSWLLGVPAPGCAPILGVAGGGNNLTLGNFTESGGKVDGAANYTYLTNIFTPGDTVLQDVQWRTSGTFFQNDDPNISFAAVVYTDNGGVPGSLLNTGKIVKGVLANEPNESAFLNPTNLSGNTQYWIGIIIDTALPFEGGPTGGASNTYYFASTFTNGPVQTAPSPGGGASANTPGLNMWGDFVTSDVIESRSYVYTWVSAYGEEGPPSPPTLLDGWSNGTWTLGLWQPPPNDLGVLRNLKSINIYRTVVGQGGATVFFFVTTVPIGTAEYVDSTPNNTVALNDQLRSTNWFPPPENLQGFTVLPNGMVAGFINQEVWFCEPYRPHAWPAGYVLTVDFPIVGLGVTNGALVVCTAATPYVISGITPGQLTQSKCSDANPCSSRASILGGDAAVSYMSPNGLIQVTAAGTATNTTDLWFTRENWVALTPPRYTRAIYLASAYYCLGVISPASVTPVDTTQAQRGFTIELDQDNTSFTIWPQPGGHRLGFMLLSSPLGADIVGLTTDPWTGIGLVISGGNLYYFDFTDTAPTIQVYTWRSHIYQQNVKRNYSAMKVFLTIPPGSPTLNPTRIEAAASDPVWVTLPADRYGFIKTYVDVDGTGNLTLIDCREIRQSGELLRIIDGFKCEQYAWEITGRILISNVQIATSPKELANV